MKQIAFLIFGVLVSVVSYGNHLKGGWIYYEALGPGAAPNTIKYRITVKQYLDCASTSAQIDQQVYLGIFTNTDNQLFQKLTISNSSTEIIQKSSFNPCISPAPFVCYRIDSYITTADLPITTAGYTLAVQRCCRIAGIINVVGSSQIGVSYTTLIPGMVNGQSASNNNSPIFAQKDTAVVCFNGNFTFDFGALDSDNDSLSYAFCDGLIGGSSGTGQNAAQPNPPSNPPYNTVPYNNGFSGSSPMGPTVTINSKTGLISGVAPSRTGDYVVAVCATEFRNGVKIGETKKEIHITVANCSLAAAELKTSYITCDGFDLTFTNESTSPLVSTYRWEFGDPNSGVNNISTLPNPTHTYSDTGIFLMKLRVESSGGCKDSTSSFVKIYPGFTADFNTTGSCFEKPFNFTDRTITRYGVVDSWRWDFGDLSTNSDTSSFKNPTYKYAVSGQRNVRLIATNSKGCTDTINKLVDVRDIPVLTLPFKDTLICSIDTLQLAALGTGTFLWKSTQPILNATTANPLVFPKDTAVYTVTLNDNGCVNQANVTVNVLNSISVIAGRDTSICRTDSIKLNPVSKGLQFIWTPTNGLSNSLIKSPAAAPLSSTKYYVRANLGKCSAIDSILIKVAPYPVSNAGQDAVICYGDRVQLIGSITGSSFVWTPTNSLLNAKTLTPIAGPTDTTRYVLTAYDTLGCPKPMRDTVVVSVIPKVKAFAGNDTNIVVNQPLQLQATGGVVYAWSPANGLSNVNIANPIATFDASIDSIIYKVRVSTAEGCFADDDIKVKIFKTGPEIFVPSGFTPNGDGRNDVLRPVVAGMKSIGYFKVYNRWGQMLFATRDAGKGWDGKFGGVDQPTGTYVFSVEATDYLDKKLVKKGTVVLIR